VLALDFFQCAAASDAGAATSRSDWDNQLAMWNVAPYPAFARHRNDRLNVLWSQGEATEVSAGEIMPTSAQFVDKYWKGMDPSKDKKAK
jgi:hypothetical protein